jgi:hypothetical protein
MAPRSSSSKTAAIAGTLAGLLAAGLGAAYVYEQRHQEQAPARPVTLNAKQTPGREHAMVALPELQEWSEEQAPATPVTLNAKQTFSREQAVAALMALPELQAWSARIEKESGGKAHGAVMEYDTQLRTVNGKRYYQLSFVENSSDAAQRWESFLVGQTDGEILVDDDVDNTLLPLQRWRAEKHPLQRNGLGE